jgi:hypothetical protein
VAQEEVNGKVKLNKARSCSNEAVRIWITSVGRSGARGRGRGGGELGLMVFVNGVPYRELGVADKLVRARTRDRNSWTNHLLAIGVKSRGSNAVEPRQKFSRVLSPNEFR